MIISPAVQKENPELQHAQELKLPVYSYPECIHRECRNKHRVVVVGSHGKSMIALLIMHVLHYYDRSFDYVLGRPIPGVKDAVRLTDAPVVIIEGLDGFSSCLDPTTVFLKYQHHIGIISGIEWFNSKDYTSKEEYTRQFSLFEAATPKGGVHVYFDLEPVLTALSKNHLFGLLRLKSYFERVHAPAIIATMACWCVMHATLLYFSMVGEGLAVHALLIALFMAVTVPVTNIFLMRAALFRARRMGEAVPANLSRTATEDAREP